MRLQRWNEQSHSKWIQETSTEAVQDLVRLVGKRDRLEIEQDIQIDPIYKWYLHKPESVRENESHKPIWGIAVQSINVILARRPDEVLIYF